MPERERAKKIERDRETARENESVYCIKDERGPKREKTKESPR